MKWTIALLIAAAAPTIPDTMRADFFQSQSAFLQAQAAYRNAQDDLNAKQKVFSDSLEALKKTCGDTHVPDLKEGKLVCVDKPAELKK